MDFGIAQVGTQELAAGPADGAASASEAPDAMERPSGQGAAALTTVGMVLGTLGYMAPEQAAGQGVDYRADLYSLGVVMWESLTGRRLFDEDSLTAHVTKQFSQPVPPPSTLSPNPIPRELDAWVLKLLSIKADDRPDSAASVRNTLQVYRNSASAHPGGPFSDPTYDDDGPPRRAVPFLRGGTVWVGMFAVGLLLATGLIAVAAFGSNHDEAEDEGSQRASSQRGSEADEGDGFVQALLTWSGLGPSTEPAVPGELEPQVRVLLQSTRYRERRQAARTILQHRPKDALPEWLVIVAELEAATRCQGKRQLLKRFATLADPRTRPSLERLARTPERGCGFLNLADCYDCLRSELKNTLEVVPRAATTLR